MVATSELVCVDVDIELKKPSKKQQPTIELEGINTMDPLQFAMLLTGTTNERLVAPPGEHEEDAFEIEFSAEQLGTTEP